MNRNFTRFLTYSFTFLVSTVTVAQCPGGYTAAELNWDHLDFLPSNNARYTGYYPSAAFPYTQNFTIGTRTVNFTMTNSIVLNGDNGTNTAITGSFATSGDDIQFTSTVTTASSITLNFDADVANVQFSLFDIDNNQRIAITASNSLGTPQNIIVAKANAGSAITVAGSGSSTPGVTGPNANYNGNDNNGTINITVTGPVKQITITMSAAIGDLWLSDIDACVTGAFPNSYQQISRPFTNQPQYVLTVVNNRIYYTDPSNGNAYFLFIEPGHNRLNSMAYDPYKRQVYYCYSLTGGTNPRIDKALKRYDVDSKTISVLIPNVNTFGIPTYESGVESGAATFYNGALYLGIEGYTASDYDQNPYAAGRKSTIWKINFDAAGNPIAPAAQVFGITADDGVNAQNIHDWSDFGISNGILYDFDGSQSGDIDYYHFNLMTGTRTRYAPQGNVVPRQVSIGWDEKLYNVDATIGRYNGTDGIVAGTTFPITSPLGPVIPTGNAASWGDAAGPYRPFLDFGDAPATYDPDPLSPACHDTLTPIGTKLMLGPGEDVEWLKKGFTTTEDAFEDALSFIPLLNTTSGTYLVRASVLNNTGSAATIDAWLDINGNGTFETGEGIPPITIPSLGLTQLINLNWTSLPSILPNGAFTYLRIRITAASSNMTNANPTGYYSSGEVEDYKILVDNRVLPMTLIDFEAMLNIDNKVDLAWRGNEDFSFLGYQIQRSSNGTKWENRSFINAAGNGGVNIYTWSDQFPIAGTSWYRLQLTDKSGAIRYSSLKRIVIAGGSNKITIGPNPANKQIRINIPNDHGERPVQINIYGMHGGRLYSEKLKLLNGNNSLNIFIPDSWSSGTYVLQVISKDGVVTSKINIRH